MPHELDPALVALAQHHAPTIQLARTEMLVGLPPEVSFTVTRELMHRVITNAFVAGAAEEKRRPSPATV